MAGFLEKDNRIVDMVLTGLGKELFSKGELKFAYWAPFDDEIDYDPFVSQSGTLTPVQLSASIQEQIEATPVREAVTGYRRLNNQGSDTTNVIRPIFTMPQGQLVIPQLSLPPNASGSLEIVVQQRKVLDYAVRTDQDGRVIQRVGPFDRGYERYDTETVTLEFVFPDGTFPGDYDPEGVLVHVLKSGSEGYVEVGNRRDFENNISYGNDLKLWVSSGQEKIDADED